MTHTLQAARADEFISILEARLPAKTVRHSISVTETMEALADSLGLVQEQVAAAGLLHDMFKGTPPEDMPALAEAMGLEISETQRIRPKLLHGPLAAETARRELEIDDPDVYEAIFWHTTGKPGLCLLGQALYYADYAEPLRSHEESAEARVLLAKEGFVPALRYIARQKLLHAQLKMPVDPHTDAFCAWLESLTSHG